MCDRYLWQYFNIKLLAKSNKVATELYDMSKNVYGNKTMTHTQVSEWHKRILDG
jgi:hypothetical protein